MTSIRSEDIIQTLQSLNLIRYLYLLHLQTSYLTQHLPSIPSLAILKYLYRILSCMFLIFLCMTFWNCCLSLLQTYVSEQRFPQFFLDNTLCRGTSLLCFPSDAIENFLFWMLFWSLSIFPSESDTGKVSTLYLCQTKSSMSISRYCLFNLLVDCLVVFCSSSPIVHAYLRFCKQGTLKELLLQ